MMCVTILRTEGAQPISCKQRSEDDNSIYEDTDTMTSSPTNEPCDYEYMCMTSTPRENQQHVDVSVAAQPGAQMVTGVSRKPGTKPDKPTVLPKPAKSGEKYTVAQKDCIASLFLPSQEAQVVSELLPL